MSNAKRQNAQNHQRNNNNKPGKPTNEEIYLTDRERIPLLLKLSDFVDSNENEMELPGLSKAQRKFLHRYAARSGLKTRSYGSRKQRVLHITRRKYNINLTDTRKLLLLPLTRRLFRNYEEMIRRQLERYDGIVKQNPYQGIARPISSGKKNHGIVLLLALDQRMIPPRAQRISNELWRDRKELPMFHHKLELKQMLHENSVFIVSGETGSGKTTQVPQFILEEAAINLKPCRILVTQPRRIAAISVAHRVAEERGEDLGESVGYQIRMESVVRKTTNLIYTTSGCLLRAMMSNCDELFRKMTHLIIDEIHERDKYTDFTLISIKEQLKLNKNLKVILMSATMDINLLSRYFDDCAVMHVPGQSYDVKIFQLEDILFHTGYRTALMEKYLNSMNEIRKMQQMQQHQQQIQYYGAEMVNGSVNGAAQSNCTERPKDDSLQELIDSIIEQCCSINTNGKSIEEVCELFDQIQYYIESEDMPVDAAHSITGLTSLMIACKLNLPNYVQYLLSRSANPMLRDGQGYTAIEYALSHSDGYCEHLLKNCGYVSQRQEDDMEFQKQLILDAYQKQFNGDNDVDHYLILSLLEGLYRSPNPGAIMVFLPGYNDIVQQRELIQSTLPSGTYRICILHGQMETEDQIDALKQLSTRKIILSTNIGQTSITIPDLVYIIDSGKVKMKTFDSVTESSQLQSVWISQADANQRSGRAGRTQNGVCYRLYSKAKFHAMTRFCVPEFMRIPLTEICLYAKTLNKHINVQSYLERALNPPSTISVQNAVRKLQMLEIFNEDESVTPLGKYIVELPVDVQLGKCIIYSIFLRCYEPVLTICAFHSVKDPFLLPTDRTAQGKASFMRKAFSGQSNSDHMGILYLYSSYVAVRHNRKRAHEFCTKNYLSFSSMELFVATRRQIADVVIRHFDVSLLAVEYSGDFHMVRLALAAGFYPNVAVFDRTKKQIVSGDEKQLILQRTSALNPPGKKQLKEFINDLPHDWVIYHEKSRVRNLQSINMNTLVSSLVVALQCGRECKVQELFEIEDDDYYVDDDDADDADDLCKPLALLNVETESKALLCLDQWIKFECSSSDAHAIVALRNLVRKQFVLFMQNGVLPKIHNSSAEFLQNILATVDPDTEESKANNTCPTTAPTLRERKIN